MADPGALPWGHRPGPGLGALSEVLTLVLSATCGPRWLSSRESPLPSAPQGSSALRGRRRAPAPAELTPDWWRQTAAGERTPGAAGGRGKRPRACSLPPCKLPHTCVSLPRRTPLLRAPGAHRVSSPRVLPDARGPAVGCPLSGCNQALLPGREHSSLVRRALERGHWLIDRAESHGAGWGSERTPLATPQPPCLTLL